MKRQITPTAVARVMREDDFIVSMTDLKGSSDIRTGHGRCSNCCGTRFRPSD